MGQLKVAEMNPVTVVANSVKAVAHDLSVYVCNACKSECNFCGCWTFGFQTFETRGSDNSSSNDDASRDSPYTLCGPMWE